MWRRSTIDCSDLCNACGLYFRLHGCNRSQTIKPFFTRARKRTKSGPSSNYNFDLSNSQVRERSTSYGHEVDGFTVAKKQKLMCFRNFLNEYFKK